MKKIILFFILFTFYSVSEELVVVGNKEFPKDILTKEEIKLFFLGKIRFIEEQRVLVMNFENSSSLRDCFEKNILEKSKRSLERYWQKAYYQGKRPPKVIKSKRMLFAFLEAVNPSLGYCDINTTLNNESNVTVLFKIECK